MECKEGVFSLAVVRDPYDYFAAMLDTVSENSTLFSQDIDTALSEKSTDDFLAWLDTLNFIPLYDPQTFYLDAKKRVYVALENLESFDYVVPYEELGIFLEHFPNVFAIEKSQESSLRFSASKLKKSSLIEKFLKKDRILYSKTIELWQNIKENDFKPLITEVMYIPAFIPLEQVDGFKAACGNMNEKMIQGFAVNLEHETVLEIEIYRNEKFLCKLLANMPRPDIQQKFKLSSGQCGFQMNFDTPIFRKGDFVELVILPHNILIPIVGNAKAFLSA
ncbi:hypothetical protein [Sulfurovum sp. NBC37-1]|uniref:hypothetical protein n=1 Tax=Sulfurovum sp. (strain NBC37-1) TaxID=387093 RepID=UPI0011D06955|nr:hypothetical protein [Sulfurovum sp. NBC37-1]